MMQNQRAATLKWLFAVMSGIAIVCSIWGLMNAEAGVMVKSIKIGTTPATIFRPASERPSQVIVIAHGFAGSQQLMQTIALGLAQNDYTAITFDFSGHGRNPNPLDGSITETTGATRSLISDMAGVVSYARKLGDGRVAVMGHSMASDIVVRFAQTEPGIDATITISMFSPVVTATSPPNLLVIVGEWETSLRDEAQRVVSLVTPSGQAKAGKTYGNPAIGTGRRFSISPHVEHASVLFSRETVRESIKWLDTVYGIQRSTPITLHARGAWILLLLGAAVVLAWPLSKLLPTVVFPNRGAGLGWRRLWFPILMPMVATPVILYFLPTQFLPVLLADYLALHFATYGILTVIGTYLVQRDPGSSFGGTVFYRRFCTATLLVVAFQIVALILPVNRFVTSFLVGNERLVLLLILLAGTLCYFLADEWMSRGKETGRGAYTVSKVAFLISLGIAIAMNLERLFFLVIIVPIIFAFFVVYGLMSRWIYTATGHPLVAGLANAFAFAWSIAVTFPLLAA
jgi:pimeloyl-ACP methyl ester carboxylesterase